MGQRLLLFGLLIFLAGFGLLLVGAASQGTASVGGAVFIGPFPIAFGSGQSGPELALVSVVIGGVMVGLMMLLGWRVLARSVN